MRLVERKPGFHMIASIVRKTWDDRGDHMETLSSAIPAFGTIEAIAIARIAQVLSQTIRAIGAIEHFLMETIPDDRGDPKVPFADPLVIPKYRRCQRSID